jgi:signal recognition particle subunit SEC65
MFNFPSGKPVYHKPSNKYTCGRKTRQRLAIQEAKAKEILKKRPILDLTCKELEELLGYIQ